MSLEGLSRWNTPLRPADLSAAREHSFDMVADEAIMAELQERLALTGLRKLRFSGKLIPLGKRDWMLDGILGATVTQPCVATLVPVTTRLDAPVTRSYLSSYSEPETGEADGEVEMPEDDTVEALPTAWTLSEVGEETLALAIPDYPRAQGAELGRTQFTEAGKEALSDEDVKPFASLKALRDKLSEDD